MIDNPEIKKRIDHAIDNAEKSIVTTYIKYGMDGKKINE